MPETGNAVWSIVSRINGFSLSPGMSRFINTSRCREATKQQQQQKFWPNEPGGRANVFFFFFFVIVFVFVIVYVNDNVDDRASCLVPQRFRLVASGDVDAALPRGPTLIRGFFFSPWPARTSAVLAVSKGHELQTVELQTT